MTTKTDVSPRRSGPRPALLLVLLPLLVGLVLALPTAGVQDTAAYFRETLGSALLWSVLASPLILFALWRSPSQRRSLLLLGVALFTLSLAVTLLPKIPFVQVLNLTWNWQGKVLDTSWALLFVLLWRGHTPAQMGLRWRLEPGSLRPVLIVTGVLTVLFAIPGFFRQAPGVEEVAYQLIMPSLSEELVFRGVLLALLSGVFGRPWRLAGAHVGWGLVITSLLFGFDHGALVTNTGLYIDPVQILATSILGALFCWIRERSGSLWPAMVAHSLVNSGEFIVPLLARLFS